MQRTSTKKLSKSETGGYKNVQHVNPPLHLPPILSVLVKLMKENNWLVEKMIQGGINLKNMF